ncbi:MAG: aminotransferase class III-fold pyridoxal phosphate-dependent enzyme [Gammaproteobacteria bacterium]|nr:aminotransferase class III-fold pyridoxal phosphate-dependent enzyme [Gammaproteobacteria bacterium]
MNRLRAIRDASGSRQTVGLPDEIIRAFLQHDERLGRAIDDAAEAHAQLLRDEPDLVRADEATLVQALQHRLINFYPGDAVNNYVAIGACGPWVVTSAGAVIHDSGGYGMLGMGHSPSVVLDAMNQRQVMANVMTPSFSHLRFTNAMEREIGQTRADDCPYDGFICMNSGSEAMTVALRIADVNAKLHTDAGGPNAGKPIRRVALSGSFHGRTERPASYSDSTRARYVDHLASFRDSAGPVTVEPNNVGQLRQVFAMAEGEGYFIEAMCMEPVMGEGNPGMALSREFYDEARRLTLEHGTVLIIDSIQAGLRATGYLSITDYPGFSDCQPPDMETFSKALNAGQYPLSVLAINERALAMYRVGIYGNTMTANPRSLDVACAVLENLDQSTRNNIRERGTEFIARLEQLAEQTNGAITKVQGTGLLVSCELDAATYKCYGTGSIEEYMRTHGIGVIHGGKHSLRFTPPFNITSAEIELVVDRLADALRHGPRRIT